MTLSQRHLSRLTSFAVVLTAAIGLLGTASPADAEKPRRKPIRPMVAIDNEGPIVVVRHARTIPDDNEEREAMPPDRPILPWRSVINLDLILPIPHAPVGPLPKR